MPTNKDERHRDVWESDDKPDPFDTPKSLDVITQPGGTDKCLRLYKKATS